MLYYWAPLNIYIENIHFLSLNDKNTTILQKDKTVLGSWEGKGYKNSLKPLVLLSCSGYTIELRQIYIIIFFYSVS